MEIESQRRTGYKSGIGTVRRLDGNKNSRTRISEIWRSRYFGTRIL